MADYNWFDDDAPRRRKTDKRRVKDFLEKVTTLEEAGFTTEQADVLIKLFDPDAHIDNS